MRKRSYSAKSNRGKAAEVFLHNWTVSRRQERKQAKKSTSNRSRKRDSYAKIADKSRRARERERLKRQQNRQAEISRIEKLASKAKLVCMKHGIDEICVGPISLEAYKLKATLREVESAIVKPRLDYWLKKGVVLKKESDVKIARAAFSRRCLQVCKDNGIPKSFASLIEKGSKYEAGKVDPGKWQPDTMLLEAVRVQYAKVNRALDDELAELCWTMKVPVKNASEFASWWLFYLFLSAIPILGFVITLLLMLTKFKRLRWICFWMSTISFTIFEAMVGGFST